MDLHDKSVKMSFCPFCMYMGANDLSYMNHIIIAHYNASYGCGKCLKQAFMSSSTLHNHKKVCLGFDKKPVKGSESKPSSGSGGDNSQGSSSMRTTLKKLLFCNSCGYVHSCISVIHLLKLAMGFLVFLEVI